ncbi:MAG: GDSL-type esterase/lipase family protein, partial [Pseudomonadales bacterium]
GGTIGLYAKDVMRFDNVSVQEPVSTAYVVLSTPIAYTTAASGNISATAQVANMPAGGSVEFLLDGGASTVVNTAPFTAQFAGAGAGNHTVEAVLRNAVNTEIDRDTNLLIGRTGEVVVGIGDSITDGIGDSFRSDNISALERVIGFQGYEAPLTDKLDATRVATPTIVINEGIGGDETFDAAFVRIDSILERHPDANRMLILLGTNDTFVPVDPGTGCSGSACDLTYKGNMQALVDKIIWADYPTNSVPSNIVPVIALGPPVFTGASPWTSAANDRIRAYHDVIQTEISGAQVGPDMFDYFMPNASTLRRSLFADNLHPNSLGYEVMAVLWHNALEPASPLALPFVLEDVTSSVATLPRQTLVENGDLIRQSGSVTVSNIPATLNGGRWVLTENDFSNTSADYLQFTVDRNVTVYIAYDAGATSRPNWMSTFVDTGLSVTTTDNNGPSLNLWSKTFSAGTVTLGGNAAAGASGSDSNYVAIIVEN